MTTKMLDAERLTSLRALASSGEAQRIRQAAGLSQPELARAIGVSPATVSRWEAQQRSPKGTAALRYLKLLERLSAPRETTASGCDAR